jgi:hypothetical protein
MLDLLTRSKTLGIKIILLATNANDESFSKEINDFIDTSYILKLESEAESLKVFANNHGVQLYGNGDGYVFEDNIRSHKRFQACYLNTNELIQIINCINTFFEFKQQETE